MNDIVFDLTGKRIWVAGHNGMVGSAVVRRLERETCDIITIDRADLDLRRQLETEAFIADQKPDAIVIAAAVVGGIHANASRPHEFLYDNLAISMNVIEGARRAGVPRLLYLGSTCINPREAVIPTPEDVLLTGPLEPTNEWYAVAKIAGIKLCQTCRRQDGLDYVSVMPTNLYGPGDNFDPEQSHVIPGLIRRMHEAKISGAPRIEIWGSGNARREFMHADDCADALVFLLQRHTGDSILNVGTGVDTSIRDLAQQVQTVVGFDGELVFDTSRPDGAPLRLLDSRRLSAMGWESQVDLAAGLSDTYRWVIDPNNSQRLSLRSEQ